MGPARTPLSSNQITSISNRKRRRSTRKAKLVLVLGGAGYLGSVLVRELMRVGFSVRVLDALLFGSRSLYELMGNENFELIEGDVRDTAVVERSMKDCHAVVHLAGIVGDRACQEQRDLAIDVNLTATRSLAELGRSLGISRFLFASSCSVYGASDQWLDESSPLNPLSIYARTKEGSESVLSASASADFAPTILRLGTLFGLSPQMRFDLVVNLFVAQAASAQRITICNGEQWRPFLHVRDAARAFAACLHTPPAVVAGQIFNVGGRTLNCQISRLAEEVAIAIPGTQLCAIKNSDRRNYRVSFEKIRTVLGYRTERTLAFGINEIYESLRSNECADGSAGQFALRRVQPAPLCVQER